MVSRERLQVLAASTAFQEDVLEKVLLLEALLEDISRHPLLSPEKLFPENEKMAKRLRTHPALTWRARNAREHHRNKSSDPRD